MHRRQVFRNAIQSLLGCFGLHWLIRQPKPPTWAVQIMSPLVPDPNQQTYYFTDPMPQNVARLWSAGFVVTVNLDADDVRDRIRGLTADRIDLWINHDYSADRMFAIMPVLKECLTRQAFERGHGLPVTVTVRDKPKA